MDLRSLIVYESSCNGVVAGFDKSLDLRVRGKLRERQRVDGILEEMTPVISVASVY